MNECVTQLLVLSVVGSLGFFLVPPPPHKEVHILIPERMDMLGSWQKGIRIADGIKVASQLTLRQEDYPGLSRGL